MLWVITVKPVREAEEVTGPVVQPWYQNTFRLLIEASVSIHINTAAHIHPNKPLEKAQQQKTTNNFIFPYFLILPIQYICPRRPKMLHVVILISYNIYNIIPPTLSVGGIFNLHTMTNFIFMWLNVITLFAVAIKVRFPYSSIMLVVYWVHANVLS